VFWRIHSIMDAKVSSEEPEWTREEIRPGEWAPGKRLLACIREYQRHGSNPGLFSPAIRKWAVLRHRFWSAVSGADIPLNCRIAGGLLIPHPNGIVIHPDAVIGPNCLILQQVTIGSRGSGTRMTPVVEGHVDIGAGAKILGGVRLGAHSRIGANAVVLCDVPPGCSAIGVPAAVRCTRAHARATTPDRDSLARVAVMRPVGGAIAPSGQDTTALVR
jgi:serine O-acetyltransferase